MDPNFGKAHEFLARCYEKKEMYQEALVEVQKAVEAGMPSTARLALVYALMGRKDETRKILNDLNEMSKRQFVFLTMSMVKAYAALGDKDRAFELIEKAYEQRLPWLLVFYADPNSDDLRADPRFPDLVRRIGFPKN